MAVAVRHIYLNWIVTVRTKAVAGIVLLGVCCLAQEVRIVSGKYILSRWDSVCWYAQGVTDTAARVQWVVDGIPLWSFFLPADTLCLNQLGPGTHTIGGLVFTGNGDTLHLLPAHVYVKAPPSMTGLVLLPDLPAYCPATRLVIRVPDSTFWAADTIIWEILGSTISNVQQISITLPPIDTTFTLKVILLNASGADTFSRAIVVSSSATPAVKLSVADTVCAGTPLFISWRVEGGSPLYLATGDGSTYTDLLLRHSYSLPGAYSITAYGISACGNVDSLSRQVVVVEHDTPALDIHVDPRAGSVPPHFRLRFWAQFQTGQLPLYLLWDFDDGTSAFSLPTDTVEHAYASEGEYTVRVWAVGACGGTGVDSIVVSVDSTAQPPTAFSIGSEADTLCPGEEVTFWVENAIYLPLSATVLWDFGNGMTDTSTPLQPVRARYSSSGSYTVYATLTVPAGNIVLTRQIVVIDSVGIVDGILTLSEEFVCPGEPLVVRLSPKARVKVPMDSISVSVLSDTGLVAYYSFSGNEGVVSLTEVGTYLVRAVGKGGCMSVVTGASPLRVKQGAARARMTAPLSACRGEVVKFSCDATGATECVWRWGDGTLPDSGVVVTHVFDTPGVYTITLRVSGGCGVDSTTHAILINDAPNINVVAPPACEGAQAQLWVVGDIYGATVLWNLGDGTTDTGAYISHQYDTAGALPLRVLVITPICQKVIKSTHLISYDSPAVASFTYYIVGDTVYFFNTSWNATSYMWIFGDGTISYETNPVHEYTYPGVYPVLLIVRNACGFSDTAITTILIISETPGGPPSSVSQETSAAGTLQVAPTVVSLDHSSFIYVQVEGKGTDRCQIALLHPSGKSLEQWEVSLRERQSFALPLPAELSSGIYLLRIFCDGLAPHSVPLMIIH